MPPSLPCLIPPTLPCLTPAPTSRIEAVYAMVKRNRNGDEIPRVQTKFTLALEGVHWSKGKGLKDSYVCIVSVNNRKCPYGPFKNKFHLNAHIKYHHQLALSKSKPGPKGDGEKKSKKKKTSKNSNFKVMTTAYLREKKEFEKKKEAWTVRAKNSWKKLEERARKEPPLGQCPLLLCVIKNAGKLEKFFGVDTLGKVLVLERRYGLQGICI